MVFTIHIRVTRAPGEPHSESPDGEGRVEYEYYHTYATVGDPRDGGALYGHPTIEDRQLMEREGSIANPAGSPGGVSSM